MKDDILIGDTPKARKRRRRLEGVQAAGRLWKHATLADIEGLVDREEFDGLCLFTLVRNPWDRVVSYYHWLRDQSFTHPAVSLAKSVGFGAFVRHDYTQLSLAQNPYGRYLQDGAGRERAGHFVRLEALVQDLAPIETHLGFSLGDLPQENTSKRARDFRGYYDSETRAIIARVCSADIRRFGYTFSPD